MAGLAIDDILAAGIYRHHHRGGEVLGMGPGPGQRISMTGTGGYDRRGCVWYGDMVRLSVEQGMTRHTVIYLRAAPCGCIQAVVLRVTDSHAQGLRGISMAAGAPHITRASCIVIEGRIHGMTGGYTGDIVLQGIAFRGMTGGAVALGVIVERHIDMAASAFLIRAVIQLRTCMGACPGVAKSAGLRTIGVAGLGIGMAESAGGPLQGHVGYIGHCIHVVPCSAFPDMTHGAVHISRSRMSACAAPIIGGDRECIQGMAALALRFGTVVQFQTGMVTGSCMAYVAWLKAIGMDGLGVRMAESAGSPVQGHVGNIRHAVQVICGYTLLDMAHGAIHVCCRGMGACAAPVIGCDGECILDMTALALWLGAVIQLQTGVIPSAAVADRAGFRTVHMAGLGIRMAQPARIPLQGHVGHIRHAVQVIGSQTFLHVADGAVDICGALVRSAAASIVGVDGEHRFGMAALALSFRTVIQLQAGMVAGSGMADDTGLRTCGMDCLGIRMTQTACNPVQWHVGHVRQCIHMIGRIALFDMTHGALHIGIGRMIPCAASVIGLYWKYRLGMAAFTLGFRTVIQLQAGMGPVS